MASDLDETNEQTSRMDAFFKQFEIPELWNMHLLRSIGVEWKMMDKPPVIPLPNMQRLLYRSPRDTKDYFIIVSANKGIDRFDIATNDIVHLTDYPDNFECFGAESVVDPKSGDLYIVGGDAKCFGIFNVESKEWDIKCLNKLDDAEKAQLYSLNSNGNDPKVINGQLYVVGWENNRYYDPSTDSFQRVTVENNTTSPTPTANAETRMCFNSTWNAYIQFGSASSFTMFNSDLDDEIWTFSPTEDGGEDVLWNKTNVSLPAVHKDMSLKYALTVDHIAILIYFPKEIMGKTEEHQIWCLNLADDCMKWHKSRVNLGEIGWDSFDVVVTADGNIHRISFEHGQHQQTTVKALLDSTRLFDVYKEKYDLLVNGFIKMEDFGIAEDRMKDVNISEIASQIMQFYSFYV